MFWLNRRAISLCFSRNQITKWLLSSHGFELDDFKSFSCTLNRKKNEDDQISKLFTPVSVKTAIPEVNAGCELSGPLDKFKLVKVINVFFRKPEVRRLAAENNLDEYLLQQGFASFRKYCLKEGSLPTDLHITLSDVIQGHGNHLDIFPFFLRHVKEMFPHLECIDDLKKIGDLTTPANWYADTRNMKRKIHFHCGPTNSGKTFSAMQKFFEGNSGVYCGPLKLLAVEVFNKSNEKGTVCDLVTGEEVIHMSPDENCAEHVSCTIEMCSLEKTYDVAIIDEIQMIKDPIRGWAWTRALLGVKAKEIHICGEEAALDLIDSILCTTNETLEVHRYERLTRLELDSPVMNFDNIQPGDCIVCFSKNEIFNVTRELEKRNVEVAVIYGALPPGTKLAQAAKFNDPDDPCKVLVATDAIGMGLNLSIRRVIFYSIMRTIVNEKGESESLPLSVSQALQIAGRAGRYGSRYPEGFVTTFKQKEFPLLKALLAQKPEPVMSAGLHPTVDQLELYSYYLPNLSFPKLIEIFVKLSTVDDSMYFISEMKDIMYLAELLDHVPMPLRAKYIFCCTPIDKRQQLSCCVLVKFAKLYSRNEAITFAILCKNIDWPLKKPRTIRDLVMLEEVHNVFDLYLWLSYRFQEHFPDVDIVKKIQREIDLMIQEGVVNMMKLLKEKQEERSPRAEEEDTESSGYQQHLPGHPPKSKSLKKNSMTEETLKYLFNDKCEVANGEK